MKDFLKVVSECKDLKALQNVVSILVDGMETGMKDADMFATIKVAYSELVGCHYSEELAKLYYSGNGIDAEVWDAAKKAFGDPMKISVTNVGFKQRGNPNAKSINEDDTLVLKSASEMYGNIINLWDWVVLYGRMSQNTKGTDAIVEACKVFLDNKFLPYYDID